MKGFAFQWGVAWDASNGGDGSMPHGGAILFVRLDMSVTKFEDCVFKDNAAILENGSTVHAVHGGNLEFVLSTFKQNHAHNGGAISASNVSIAIEDTNFIGDTAIRNFEGAAILCGHQWFKQSHWKGEVCGQLKCIQGKQGAS